MRHRVAIWGGNRVIRVICPRLNPASDASLYWFHSQRSFMGLAPLPYGRIADLQSKVVICDDIATPGQALLTRGVLWAKPCRSDC